ncbi:hypothetical protein ACROYT_G030874 [Oculina patagonica]
MASVNTRQKNQLIDISKGIPLVLIGLAAILRQEQKSADDLIAGVHKRKVVPPKKSKSEEDGKEKPFSFQEEGVDVGQLSAIREMFDSLPTDSLKVSAVSISLFCGPFSASTAAKVFGISQSEALAQLEGLVTSAIIFVVDEGAKERMYDIHPLLRKYADSIKDDAKFQRTYLEAKGRFRQHFMTKLEAIAKLIEPDYVRAFRLFESDRPNYEFTVDISLQPGYFSIPGDFRVTSLIASLFNAMLTEDKQIKLFHCWAEMCEDDRMSGSLCRAQLKCWEARQVSDVEGPEKAFEVLKEASLSLENVQDKTSNSYKLSKGLYLYHEGEIYHRNRDYKRSLESLESSLKFSEELLKVHTDVARCYNAIGNCYYALDKPMKALDFYKIAYHMQEQLAGSERHFDMPMYKNQIGTVYESQGEYDKAIECYKKALRLLDELKLLGFHDEAHFQRNLANALMFQKKYDEAVAPADRAYNIRMKILENHPLTVRSIFQRAVIQANFGEDEKALKLFLEAWEMEKSLGPGNHSEVWRKIITGVEDMYDETTMEKFLPSFLSKKEQFKEDAMKFCQRFWDEQKRSAQFGFTEYNKDIIDAILYLLGDKEDKHEAGKDALWFYEGLQSASEEEFQKKFDQETDNSLLNDMLKERDQFLDKVIQLCRQLRDHEKLSKHKNIKLALYKKVLVRPDFAGERKHTYDKATLKSKVEQLYQELGQVENIPEFRENLFYAWEKQWEEGKRGVKTKEIGVAMEQTINGILQLSKELNKQEMFRRYGEEALNFHEILWEVKQTKMKAPEMEKFLRDIKELASSIGDHEREKCYHEAYQALQDGQQPKATLRSTVKEFASKSDEEEDGEEEEKEIKVDSEDKTDTTMSVNENRKTFIRRGEVSDGDTWNLKEAAASITFCRGAETEPLLISCSLWSPRTLSPPLGRNEALVSNVIELSHDGPPDVEFSGDAKGNITVALLHSASNLKGYEVVIKQLVDPENNEWKDLETNTIWHTSAKPAVPNWLFPFAEAACTITRHSSFGAIWRLKSFIFPKPTSVFPEFTCIVPDFPDVSVAIPWNSVPTVEDFYLTLKVQEPPSLDRDKERMLVGPILHISCSHDVELLEPAKLKVPLAFFEGKRELADLSSGQWRILHYSREKSQEWAECTDQLEMPPVLIDGIVTFQVKHFCRIWIWRLKQPFGVLSKLASDLYSRVMAQRPGFLACLCDDGNDERPTDYLLTLSCFPINLKYQVTSHISKSYVVDFQGEGTSIPPLCVNDQAFASLSEAFLVQQGGETDDLYLIFLGDEPFERSWRVSVCDVSNLQVEFLKRQDGQGRRETLCTLFIIPRSPIQSVEQRMFFWNLSGTSHECQRPTVKRKALPSGTSGKRKRKSPSCTNTKRSQLTPDNGAVSVKEGTPKHDDLQRLAKEVVEEWKKLGRQLLDNDEAKLCAIHKQYEEYSEKAYQMLLKWKQANGSGATFQVLHDALCNRLVDRKDLAQTFCLVDHD